MACSHLKAEEEEKEETEMSGEGDPVVGSVDIGHPTGVYYEEEKDKQNSYGALGTDVRSAEDESGGEGELLDHVDRVVEVVVLCVAQVEEAERVAAPARLQLFFLAEGVEDDEVSKWHADDDEEKTTDSYG